MALKLVLEKAEHGTLADALKSLYVEKDGKFFLDAEGIEDTNGLKSALEKERKGRSDLEKQIRAWQGLGKTPEEITELIEAQRKAEDDKAAKAGEWDKLKAQMNEKHAGELAKKDEEAKRLRGALESYLVDAAATQEIASAKGIPALLLPHVKASVKVVEENGKFSVVVVGADGATRVNGKGDPLAIKDLVAEMKASDVFGRAFDASGNSGGGVRPGGGASGTAIRISRADAQDVAKYRSAKAQAEKAGVPLEIEGE